jgi:AraC-like DNA-binding protein
VVYEEALAVIERSYGDHRLSVDDLSRRVFVSRRQLQRAFTEAGTSVQERLHAVRMQHAAELLRETSLPVSEITRMVGYRHSAQFAKAFRRYYGLAPTQWRKRAVRGDEKGFPAVKGLGRLSTA